MAKNDPNSNGPAFQVLPDSPVQTVRQRVQAMDPETPVTPYSSSPIDGKPEPAKPAKVKKAAKKRESRQVQWSEDVEPGLVAGGTAAGQESADVRSFDDDGIDVSSASHTAQPSTPLASHFSAQERAALVAAAMKGDTSGLLTAAPEGAKRAKKGQYNPSRFVGTRRITPARIKRVETEVPETGETVTVNKDVFSADITTRGVSGVRGFVPITSDVSTAIAGASTEPSGFSIPFSQEDPPILRRANARRTRSYNSVTGGEVPALPRSIERHNIIAAAIQDRNSRRIREHMERQRPADQPRVVSRGVRSGQERFERTDTGQEVATTPNVGPPASGGGRPVGSTPVETVSSQAKAASRAASEEATSRGMRRVTSGVTGETSEVPIDTRPPVQGPPAPTGPLGSADRPFTPEQDANVAAQRSILARQGAAQQAAQARRAAGQARRQARMAEAVEARRAADAPDESALPDESDLPAPTFTVGGRPSEQRAALIAASAAMRGRMPLVSTADPEQVNRGARAAAARLDDVRRMFEVGPRRLEGGGRGPRSFLDPEAAAGRAGDLRDAQISDFAFGEDPEQIDVDMSNQILGAVRRQTEAESILAGEMKTDAEGRPLRAPATTSTPDSSRSTERAVSEMVRSSDDPYINMTTVFNRVPVVGQQFDRGQPGVVNQVLRSGEGAVSRRDALAAQERRAGRLANARQRQTEREAAQRAAELARRDVESGRTSAPAPAPARQLGPNAVTTPGPDDTSRIAKEIADRAMAGENLEDLKREYGIN